MSEFHLFPENAIYSSAWLTISYWLVNSVSQRCLPFVSGNVFTTDLRLEQNWIAASEGATRLIMPAPKSRALNAHGRRTRCNGDSSAYGPCLQEPLLSPAPSDDPNKGRNPARNRCTGPPLLHRCSSRVLASVWPLRVRYLRALK